MKGVFLGSDFMYRQDGKLVPIEINTNVALDAANRVESWESTWHLEALAAFVKKHSVTKIVFEGVLGTVVKEAIDSWSGPEFDSVILETVTGLERFNDLEDSDTVLKVRTSYSDEAFVDAYCRDKIEFLKLNQNEDFGQSFLWKTGEGNLEGNIVVVDNDNHPNFIVKYRYPQYDGIYPKLLRFETEAEVRVWAEKNLEVDYYITPFLYSKENLVEFPNSNKRLGVYRHIAILVAVDDRLVSVPVGVYTKYCNDSLLENPGLDMYRDNVLREPYRKYYLSKNTESSFDKGRDLLAEKGDEILMADGTWKKVQDIKEGDKVRSLKVEGKDGADIHSHIVDYNESLEEFEAETEFEEAEIISLRGPVEGYVEYVRFEFEDGVAWNDTAGSSYLILDPEDNTVRFQTLDRIKPGDTMLLLDASETDSPLYLQKIVATVSTEREFVSGYSLSLDGSHIFLSRETGMPEMFASIEHNITGCTCSCRNGRRYLPTGVSRCNLQGMYCCCYEYKTIGCTGTSETKVGSCEFDPDRSYIEEGDCVAAKT